MDLKGITWVGHVYQKFEAMCLEMEEVMYQDTVKYVEDQVQTVGVTVKKFYSDVMQDVMQDLLLPSSLEPVKSVAASDTPLEKYVGTLEKPNLGLKEAAIKGESEQLLRDSEVISDVNENASHVPSSCRFHSVDDIFESCPGRFRERASSDLLSEEYNSCTLDKSIIENLPRAGTFSEASCVDNEFSRIFSFPGNANANHEVSCQQIPTTLTRVAVEEDDCHSIEETCDEVESASESMLEILNDELQLVESIGKKEMAMRCSSSVIESAESNGQSNNLTMDTSERTSSTSGRKEAEPVQPFDKTRVDESCILVNGAELRFHYKREGKQKPYQIRIRDVISSRMRSARKKEYEKLALWYGDVVKSDQDCEGSSKSALLREDTGKSVTREVLDSEWELL